MTQPARAPKRGPTKPEPATTAVFQEAIAGRFRRITTQQIALAWWLHQSGHLTRRQLRVYFAAHEMAERRRYIDANRKQPTKPHYRLEEIRKLVGGRSSPTAERALRADLRKLGETGLVKVALSMIHFAQRAEDLSGDIDLTSFWDFFQELPNRQRTVPVPRRTLRALAAGLRRAETAYVLAALIRSVFWHRESKLYRTDGRTKLSWVAKTFGISRRAVTDARTRLIELGWIQPLEAPQWALNRWGVHEVIQVDQALQEAPVAESGHAANESITPVGEGRGAAGSASPRAGFEGGSASPCLNRSSSSTRNQETRKLGASAPGPTGLSQARKDSGRALDRAPSLRDIQDSDLDRPEALVLLRQQAIERGFRFQGEVGELDFFALANRAKTRGHRPAALFFDLVSNHRVEFITLADEEVARVQLRELREGPTVRSGDVEAKTVPKRAAEPSAESKIVAACLQVAREQGFDDPFRVAQMAKGWTREQWDDARLRFAAERSQSDSVPFIPGGVG